MISLPTALANAGWDALFVSKEIIRIRLSFDINQSFEIVLEVFVPPNAGFFDACVIVTKVISSDFQILAIEICSSGIFGNIGSHVIVQLSVQLNHPLGFFIIIPFRIVHEVEFVAPVRECGCRLRDLIESSARNRYARTQSHRDT